MIRLLFLVLGADDETDDEPSDSDNQEQATDNDDSAN